MSQLFFCLWLAVCVVTSAFHYQHPGLLSLSPPDELTPVAANARSLKQYFAANRLSDNDVLLYQHLFALAKERQWSALDTAATKLARPDLLGWLKARELTDRRYDASASELAGWLDRNAHLPQAASIKKRLARLDAQKAAGYELPARTTLASYDTEPDGHDLYAEMSAAQRAQMENAVEQFAARRFGIAFKNSDKLARESKKVLPGARWIAGLSAWHLGKMDEAYREFVPITVWAQARDRSEWLSQSSYWAYRAALNRGWKQKAVEHLAMAARDRHQFYGMLSASAMHQTLELAAEEPDIALSRLRKPVLEVIANAALLHDIGQIGEAEDLLRGSFVNLAPQEQQALVWTAAELHLADVQLPMANRIAVSDLRSRYPIPEWKSRLKLDPALVLAIVRRESGFNASAGSPVGAQGLMQIMPATADFLIKQYRALEVETASDSPDAAFRAVARYRGGSLKNPDVNLAIGQAYLHHLANVPEVGDNLIWLLASYNAGPGVLQGWNSKRDIDDPLLFIESIPFRETRNYVKNVLTDDWIYSALLKKQPASLQSLAEDRWPEAGV